ncbi:MAG: cell envelope integrity protein TolA [Prolixibacteraceae bacterium]
MTWTENQKQSILMTLLLHAVVMILLLMVTLTRNDKLQSDEGLLVDFGFSDTGKGDEEPSAVFSPNDNLYKPPVQADQKAATPQTPAFKPKDIKEEDLLTQDHEPAAALKTAKTPKKIVEKKKPDPAAEAEKVRKQEQLAQERLEAQNLQKKKKEEQMIGNINSRVKNAFGGGLTDNGSTSKSEGNTYGTGNQGDPNGQPGVKRYGPGGGTGNNISYNLSGRQARFMPKPAYPGNEGGIVVVEVTVDKLGKVSAVRTGIFGSTSSDPDLLEAAAKAAKSATFNVDDNAPAFQKGTITYHFVLQ